MFFSTFRCRLFKKCIEYCPKKWIHSKISKRQPKKWSYLSGHSEQPLMGTTIGELLETTTYKHPDKKAFIFPHQNTHLTFEQLLIESDKLAGGLKSLGLDRGDRVGIWASNCQEWIITMFGTARAGMILVNLNPSYQPKELEYCLKKVGVKALVMKDILRNDSNYEKILQIIPNLSKSHKASETNLPDLRQIVMIGEKDYPGTIPFKEVQSLPSDQGIREIESMQHHLQFDDAINIQFTSGTTGRPKGATLSHHNIINNTLKSGERLKFHLNETVICSPVPLFHTFGTVIAALQTIVHSSTVVIPAATFDAQAALQAIHNHKCTTLYGTPTMFIDYLNTPNLSQYDLSSLDNGIIAGAVCPEDLYKKIYDVLNMKHLANCYGMTENSPITFQTMYEDDIKKRYSTVGKIQDYVEAKIVDENGDIVEVGKAGELWTRGYLVMKGYWQDEEKTKESMNETWYKTGDIAVFDDEGYCKIVGRNKDMIIRGGENIYPAEIEDVLFEHPNIKDAQVIGVPDSRLGEQVAVWIKLKNKDETNEDDIREFCKKQLAYFKIPKYISFVEAYPTTATGKIQKFKMRAEAAKMYKLE